MTVVKPAESVRGQDLTAEFRVPQAFRMPGQPRANRRTDPPGTPRRSAYAPVPLPPTDAEKYVYDKRRLPVLMIASFVSFSCLLTSQTLLLRSTPAMLFLAPAVGFTMIYYLVSVTVNIFTKGFSFEEHDRIVGRGVRSATPRSTCSCRCAASQPTSCRTPGRMCGTWPGRTRDWSMSTCWTTRRSPRCGGWRWPFASTTSDDRTGDGSRRPVTFATRSSARTAISS